MLNFVQHADSGSPILLRDDLENWFYIKCEKVNASGRWLGLYSETVAPGRTARIKADLSGIGRIVVTWWTDIPGKGALLSSMDLGFGKLDAYSKQLMYVINETVVVPDKATRLRVELRHSGVGRGAEFANVSVEFLTIEEEVGLKIISDAELEVGVT